MRFDLLVQEFLHDAIVEKKISIFGADFWRPLVNVKDMSEACILAIKGDKKTISGEIFNVGSDKENFTKRELANYIKKKIPETKIEIITTREDPRNYRVSFEKIEKKLMFTTKETVQESIDEILKEIISGKIDPRDTEFSNISKLTQNIKTFESYSM
jgi:nucleoside-diphosphate-sugar epimerase